MKMEFIENFWFSILIGFFLVIIDYKKNKFKDINLTILFSYGAVAVFSFILWLICIDLDMSFAKTAITPIEEIGGGKLVFALWATVTTSLLYTAIYIFKKFKNAI